jgi:hypothetical protein
MPEVKTIGKHGTFVAKLELAIMRVVVGLE